MVSALVSSEFYVFRSSKQSLPEWIYFCLTHSRFRDSGIKHMTGTGGLQRVPRDFVKNFQIPMPPLEIQKKIITEIQTEQALVKSNRDLITRFEEKIRTAIDRIWSKSGSVALS